MGETKSAASSTDMRVMGDIIERLKRLNYETHFVRDLEQRRVYPDTFIEPASDTALQFNHYIALVQWLFSILGQRQGRGSRPKRTHKRDHKGVQPAGGGHLNIDFDRFSSDEEEGQEEEEDKSDNMYEDVGAPFTLFWAEEYENPNTIAQRLMYSLQSIDSPFDFPIEKLKQTYGEVVCSILDFLTTKAMEAMEVMDLTVSKSRHSQADSSDEGREMAGQNDNIDDTSQTIPVPEAHHEPKPTSPTMTSSNRNDYPKVDPNEWARELERVGPLLESNLRSNHGDDNDGTSRYWRAHVNHFIKEYENFVNESDVSRAAIERLYSDTTTSLEQIQLKEMTIHDKFTKIANDHRQVTLRINELEVSNKESATALNTARDELHSLSQQLAKVKAMIDERGNSMTNTNPLVRIKTALQNIKSEIRDYDLEIGVLEHTLLHKRLENHAMNSSSDRTHAQ